MKPHAIGLTLFLLLAGCDQAPPPKPPAPAADPAKPQREAITAIFKRRLIARQNATDYSGNWSSPTYVKELHEISTEGTPQDFRLAWLDYVQTWERLATMGGIKRLTALAEFGTGLAQASPGATQDGLKRLDSTDTTEAFRRVVRVALQHEVTAP